MIACSRSGPEICASTVDRQPRERLYAGQVHPPGFAAEPIVDRDTALRDKHERSTFLCVASRPGRTPHIVVITMLRRRGLASHDHTLRI
jgi:hypothetical protein